ncbi:MAG: alpha/beta fold hydrolase [Ignavibacteria bacterium]
MISIINPALRKSDSEFIYSSLFTNSIKASPGKPLIIFAHGFKGFKDWGGFPFFCAKLAESGFAVLSFNFRHNGVNEASPMDFTELDKFSGNTHSLELSDINAVINSIAGIAKEYNIDTGKIGLVGHSRGGGVSIITAANDDRIKALVTLSSIAKFDRYTIEQKKRWREKGFIEIPNTRTNQMMRMNIGLLNDIEENSEKLNILNAASRLNKPFMIIHGGEDLAVKHTDAESIFASSEPKLTELRIIANTGHTFGVEHPFKGTTKAFDEVIKLTTAFFETNLS